MKKYLQFYKLYYVWFALANFIGFWIFFFEPVPLPILFIIKASFFPAIYQLAKPSVKKYFCYFQNLGYPANKLFISVACFDFAAFILIILIINSFKDA